MSACPPVICPFLSYKELRSSVLVSCDSSTADFLNVPSLSGSPEELCKLGVFRLSSPDKALMLTTKLARTGKNCDKRKMKASIPEFSANLPSINTSNSSETGKPIPCVITIMMHAWDMSSVGFLRRAFSFSKNVSIWKEQIEPQKIEGPGKSWPYD